MLTSPGTMEVWMEAPDNTKKRPVMWFSSTVCGYLLKEPHIHMSQRNVQINDYWGTIYNSYVMEQI